MGRILKELRPVYVVGIGLHRYQRASEKTYVELGLTAIREALQDAKIEWEAVESSYVGTAKLGMAAGRAMLRHLGTTGTSITHIENASATGSSAFRQACIEIAGGFSDVALAVGVDKVDPMPRAFEKNGIKDLASDAIVPFTHFALLAHDYMSRYGVTDEQIAQVAVKNHRNGALNPYAHRQKERTLDEVLSDDPISGSFTRLQCCPIGEGASAVIVASEEGIKRFGIDPSRAIRVSASVSRSERVYEPGAGFDAELTRETTAIALKEADITVKELDVIEFHDAFTIEELLYVESLGLCGPGQAPHLLAEGAMDIGGQVAVSPSGGLLAMGHPTGPTGLGQIAEVTRQLRHEAGPRQQPKARTGLAHMVGLGSVCVVHVLQRP
ncbi:thiolase family protein [Bacillus dakarensis]|uniref:thiolase family protein n=1 Tax=Robertmurraya dakarensis TaxID=1926278 RepID=UPI000982361B|nr:thiolase family protein [Bacillus dakarensis]